MGCDIHAHFEIKLNGKWHHYSKPRIERNYALFARIANVRNYDDGITPLTDERGLPDDLSVITQFEADRMQDDAHSHTWLNATEIKLMVKFGNEQYSSYAHPWHFEHEQLGYLCGNSWDNWGQYPDDMDKYDKMIEDIRFVCWFDN